MSRVSLVGDVRNAAAEVRQQRRCCCQRSTTCDSGKIGVGGRSEASALERMPLILVYTEPTQQLRGDPYVKRLASESTLDSHA